MDSLRLPGMFLDTQGKCLDMTWLTWDQTGTGDSHTAEVVLQKAAGSAEGRTLSPLGEPGHVECLDKLYPAASALFLAMVEFIPAE